MAPTLTTTAVVVVLLLVVTTVQPLRPPVNTPLDQYVKAHDPHYNWTVLPWTHRGPDFTLYAINMTSQKWLTEAESSQPIWWHYMYVAVPDNLSRPDAGALYISYGSNGNDFIPDVGDEFISFISLMAVSTGTVCANLRQIPNQPIVFKNDPTQEVRSEDAVIAWTWYQFIQNNGSADWLLRLPMTKAAVRAMDTITAFTKTLHPEVTISKFMVMGESKRGWTTWTTAAVDSRVVAIVPMVMDLLNIVENLHHHYQSLGGWTFAFNDYYALNITMHLDNPRTQEMADIIDPYTYRDRLRFPAKYIISTGGDEFFLPDDSYYYFAAMTGDIHLRTIPNAEHSLTYHRPDIFFGVRAFFISVIDKLQRPNITWTKSWTKSGAMLTVFASEEPLEVNVHFAKTIDGESKRDFRLACADPYNPDGFLIHPVFWEKRPVNTTSSVEYFTSFDNPETGWIAFHIHVLFKGPDGSDYEYTTENVITPNRLPYDRCAGDACYGRLV
ncbi:autocrine proliferation repressor protein A-like [Littorina saxatilis]|uniref:Uncharacterized protein n=1 Tax=Littorina saxatilis TaxID=31220 RepID=A0AAN9BBB5_9CAEN